MESYSVGGRITRGSWVKAQGGYVTGSQRKSPPLRNLKI